MFETIFLTHVGHSTKKIHHATKHIHHEEPLLPLNDVSALKMSDISWCTRHSVSLQNGYKNEWFLHTRSNDENNVNIITTFCKLIIGCHKWLIHNKILYCIFIQ